MSPTRVLVTGGAGFIGSAVVRLLIRRGGVRVLNLDALTYAANLAAVENAVFSPLYAFLKADIADRDAVRRALAEFRPEAVMNLAAETHVDRSIDDPLAFVRTNVLGTATLLHETLGYWRSLDEEARARFRFLHVSTDEVFGALGEEGAFTEASPYRPNSPYAASKAGADHLARAFHRTYGLPVLVSNCSNNYGPWQFWEKLIPLMTIKALRGETLPVYGRGLQVRDWLFVEDHAEALWTILTRGTPGETYLVGGGEESRNIDTVGMICDIVDDLAGADPAGPRRRLITFVPDRPGHDHRYAIDCSKIARELGWRAARRSFAAGLRETVGWYLAHREWWEEGMRSRYDGARLGLGIS
ncbi:MAG: dTDP-glucose 4,6-dehydratase [Elioraea sp.]|nr:dTDP-glucose 4,6-dehydratase [Elioraea sp.]